MGRRRHGLFPNAADLVHFPRKAFFNQATSVLVPCPPHWISPLWEQEYPKSRAERIPYLKHEARIPEPLVSPYNWAKPVDSQRLNQAASATRLPLVEHKAVPFPHLHPQDVNKATSHHKHPSANSVLAKPKADFRSRGTSVPLTSARKHLALLDSKQHPKGPLDSSHRAEAPSGPSYFPKIFADCDQRPEDRSRPPSQRAQSSKFHYHKAEFPFMSNRSAVPGSKAFPKGQAKGAHKAGKTIHSFEALPRPRIQGKVPTAKYHPAGLPSSRLDYWCRATSLKTADHWVQAKTFKVSNCKHSLKETVSLLRCIDNRSKDRSALLINLNGRARASTACPSCPQHWSIATALPSPGPNHQAGATLSRDLNPGEAPLFALEDPCPGITSSPFAEAPLGPDYTAEDPHAPPLLSESQVSLTMIPVCLECGKATQDAQPEATTLPFPPRQKSTSVGSTVHIAPLERGPGSDAQTAPSFDYHQNTKAGRSQDYLIRVLQGMNPKKRTPKGSGHLAQPLPSNGHTAELAAAKPNGPQTILPTGHDNQDSSRLDQGSAWILSPSDTECRTTYSPSPDDPQAKHVQGCHNRVTPQERPNQGDTKAPGAEHQAVTLTHQDQEDKLSIGIEIQNKAYQVHLRPPTLDPEPQEVNPHRSDPQMTPPPRYDYRVTDAPDPHAPLHAELEQQETMAPEIQPWGPAPIDQGDWETSPPSTTDPKDSGLSGTEHGTTPPSSSDPRAIIPPRLEHQAKDAPDAGAQAILQTEQECEALPPGINHQVMTLVDLSHKVVISLNLGLQNIALPEYQTIAPQSIDQKTKDALGSSAQIFLQNKQDHWQAIPLGTDNRVTTIEVQDREAILSLNPECQVTLLLRTDHQRDSVSDASDKASEVRLKLSQREMPQEYYQYTSLPTPHERGTPSLLIELQEVTLSDPSSQNKQQSIPDHPSETVPDPNTWAVPPLDPYHSGKILMGSGEGTSSSGPRPSLTLLSSPKNETEAKLYVTNPKGTIPCLDEKKTVPPSSKYKAQIRSVPKCPSEISMDCDPYLEDELSSKNLDEVQPGLQHQTHSRKNFIQTPWCLNYIKPYTIEGGDVPEKIVENIISSIPQDKLKSDICKKSILQKMKRGSSLYGDQDIPLDYSVCLICASWIPHGCPHVWGMENPCEIKLLALPMPLTSSEEVVNVKFVLQLNQPTKYPIFTFPYSHYNFPSSIAHPMNSPISSHSALELPGFSRRKWLSFMLGRDSQKGRTLPTKQWPYTEKMAIRTDGSREERTLKEHRTFLRSLLGIFQKKQRKN
ncbi:uncharacterized protein LOC103103701 [Monodelphis domestica]|uniref:uncharacterized protein LOC103103701 n=1 Tax=Monodelphis domestica TaxID=13616 RepID=UPI0024E23E99|nr:uncharacterized protein LOC103103701 [Monodelphis domestica]